MNKIMVTISIVVSILLFLAQNHSALAWKVNQHVHKHSRKLSQLGAKSELARKVSSVSPFRRFSALSSSSSSASSHPEKVYSIPDQKRRHANALASGNARVLNIDQFYDPSFLAKKNVLVVGGNRGIGRAIVDTLVQSQQCQHIVTTSRQAVDIPGVTVVAGIDVTDNHCGEVLVQALQDKGLPPFDIIIHNAGYFYEPVETLQSLNFAEELKMIDICALGPLRIVSSLVNHHCINTQDDSKIAIITSQGGSISWRFTQNPQGQDYGHHMSKAAANMAGVLLAQELASYASKQNEDSKKQISVVLLHPGFNKTDMTKKYAEIWAEEGAVESSIGAKRVLHEINQLTPDKSGSFINCEDGLHIPF